MFKTTFESIRPGLRYSQIKLKVQPFETRHENWIVRSESSTPSIRREATKRASPNIT
jgi:hypothetical protein